MFFGLAFLLAAAAFVVWLVALVEVLRTPEQAWVDAGQDRLVWALVVIFLNVLGALVWFAIGRPAVERSG